MQEGVGRVAPSRARLVLLAACALCFILLLGDLISETRIAGTIGWDTDRNYPISTVTYLAPGLPAARSGLRVGDKVDQRPLHGSIAGEPQVLHVQRGSRHLQITVVPTNDRVDPNFWLDMAGFEWSIGFAAVLALFGTGKRAALLAWLLLLSAIGSGLLYYLVSPWSWLNDLRSVPIILVGVPASAISFALLTTISSTFARPMGPLRRTLAFSTYAAAGIGAALTILSMLSYGATPGLTIPVHLPKVLPDVLWSLSVLLSVLSAVAALAAVRNEERQRAAWLLVPLAATWLIVVTTLVASYFAGEYWTGKLEQLKVVSDIAQFILPVVLTYAVLKRRLLDVDFFLNRTVVFAGISVVVIGTFILTEWLLNRVFVEGSRSTSIIVSIMVALALGVSMRFIHLYVDRVVDHIFFRARHERERSLRAFAHEAAFITDYDALLDETEREISKNAETDCVSILVRAPDGSYVTVRGPNAAVERVDENDRAVVKLRTWHTPIDLEIAETVLHGVRAYPLMCRGDLCGILVCGAKRDGQGYAPDESEALANLARGVGSALGMLRANHDDLEKDSLRGAIFEMRDLLHALVAALSPNMHDIRERGAKRLA